MSSSNNADWLSANPSAEADYTILTVLGTVIPRTVTIVDTTQSTVDNDSIVEEPEVAEDGEELID
jgi:hypothetical protein